MMEKKNKKCSLAEKEKLAKLSFKHRQEYEIEEYEVVNDLEIDKDENIFDIFSLCRCDCCLFVIYFYCKHFCLK